MNARKLSIALTLGGMALLTGGISVADEPLFSDDFESGQKPEWTYYADSPGVTAVTEINADRYKDTPTHSLYMENLEGNFWGESNGVAYAELDLSGLPLTIPYTIEFWFFATESTYNPYYNHWDILGSNQDISVCLYDDPDGIHISDGTGWHELTPPFEFQSWVKVKYTRTGVDAYVLEIGDWTWTGQPSGDSVSTVLTFGDYRAEFGKGAGSWDDLVITRAALIPTVSEWGLIAMAVLVMTAGTLVFIRRRSAEE